jgi:hypothetical protein
METTLLCGPKSNSSKQAPTGDDVVQVVSSGWINRRLRFEEDLSMRCGRADFK